MHVMNLKGVVSSLVPFYEDTGNYIKELLISRQTRNLLYILKRTFATTTTTKQMYLVRATAFLRRFYNYNINELFETFTPNSKL